MARQMSLHGLTAFQAQASDEQSSEIKVLNWNIRNPSLKRAHQQAEWIVKHDVNVVILTEAKQSEGCAFLQDYLKDCGFDVLLLQTTHTDYAVIIAVKGFCNRGVEIEAPFLPQRVVSAVCETLLGKIGIIGLYVPSRGPIEKRNVDKREFQDQISKLLNSFASAMQVNSLIIGGDFNVLERNHTPHYPIFGEWEYQFYESFIKAGLTDAYRLLHPNNNEYSWFGRQGDGYRFDHFFISAKLSPFVQECSYIHDAISLGLSDHSAMYLKLATYVT